MSNIEAENKRLLASIRGRERDIDNLLAELKHKNKVIRDRDAERDRALAAAIAAEREACAKIADTYSAQADKSPSDFQRGYCEACHDLAVEFRARGQEVKP